MDEIRSLIEQNEKEIKDVVRQIEDVESTKQQKIVRKIEEVERKLSDPNLSEKKEEQLREDLRYLRKEKARLGKKEEQLRKEKEQLRKKEEQLREEKAQLRKKEEQLQLQLEGPVANKPKLIDFQQICAQFYDALFNASEENSILKFGCDLRRIPSEMLVREAYVELHNRIHEDPKTSAIILGNPGIGKSYFSFYELLRLFRELVEKKSEGVIVYESVPLNLFMVLNAEKVDCVCDISQRYSLRQIPRVSYYLFDAGTKAQPTPQLTDCKAIVFSSPDKRNYIDFLKNQKPQVLLFYMPVWSLDELRLLPNPNGINVDERFQLFGGIPRYVFNSQYTRRHLDVAILESKVSAIHKFVGECDVGENSHKILQLVVDTTSYREPSVGFASPYVVQKYYQKLEKVVMHSPMSMLIQWQDKLFLSAAHGQLFEVWAHKKLVQGGSFTVRHLGTGEETTLRLPQMNIKIFSNLTELNERHSFDNNAYLQPTQSNFVAVDAFAGDKLFQMTVGKEHTLKVEGLNKCLLAIGRPPSQHFCLYFVVPDDIFDDRQAFRRKQNYVTKAGRIASRIPPLVNSIQQYVLRLSLEKLCPESA